MLGGSEAKILRGGLRPALKYRLIPPAYILLLLEGRVNSGLEEYENNEEDLSFFTCPNTHESDRDWERERKAARFFVKARIGIMVGLAKMKRFRWWTLTESNESIEAGMNFSHSWSMMRKWLARLDEQLEYCLVEHIQGDRKRRNWHVLTYGENRLPVNDMRGYWKSHYLSTITGLQEVKNPFKSASYLAGYLGKDDKFVKVLKAIAS